MNSPTSCLAGLWLVSACVQLQYAKSLETTTIFGCQLSTEAALQLHAWMEPATNLPSRIMAGAHDEQKYLVCAHEFALKLQ